MQRFPPAPALQLPRRRGPVLPADGRRAHSPTEFGMQLGAAAAMRAVTRAAIGQPGGDLGPLPRRRIEDAEIAARRQSGGLGRELVAEIVLSTLPIAEIGGGAEVADQDAVLRVGDAVVLDRVAHLLQ